MYTIQNVHNTECTQYSIQLSALPLEQQYLQSKDVIYCTKVLVSLPWNKNHLAQIFMVIELILFFDWNKSRSTDIHDYRTCFLFRWNKSCSTDIRDYRACFLFPWNKSCSTDIRDYRAVFSSTGTNHVSQIFVIIVLVFSSAETNHVAQIFIISALFFLPLEQIIFHRYSWL